MSNKYTMNKTLLRALAKLAKNPRKKASQIGLTKSEYSVYTKLKFWGFIERMDDGFWIVTTSGHDFLNGKSRVVKEITYFRNRIVESSGFVTVDTILDSVESKQKYREYMESMNGQLS